MKKTIKRSMLLASLLLTVFTTTIQAQSQKASKPHYKDMVMENPNAEADIQVVSDFVNSLVSGNIATAKAKLAKNYMGYGPSSADSATGDQTIKTWEQDYKTQSNRKVDFVAESFRVKSGALKGNCVSLWGDSVLHKMVKTSNFLYNIPPV
ncbi:MAG: hypothetical protein ABI237_07285 [Ginsengibacter sp.]